MAEERDPIEEIQVKWWVNIGAFLLVFVAFFIWYMLFVQLFKI